MANTSRIWGFRPVYHLMGAPIMARRFFIPSTDGTAVYPGDVVKLAGSSDTDGNYATVQLSSAGDAVIGVVRNFDIDPTNLNVDGQGRAASTNRYCYVFDDPFLVFEAETGNDATAILNTDVGLNVNHATGTPNSTFARSGAYIDMGGEATTAALTFKILAIVSRPDNAVGNAACKVHVKINNHQYVGTGVLGA